VEINQAIKELLLLNDCVIIPEFGGFVCNYRPAQIKHNRFNPPSKEIAFNPKLQANDGLLINFISEREGIGYFDAKQQVDDFVEESFLKLENYDRIVFEGIGQLYYDQKENLLFEPSDDTNLLIDSYGLESFSYEKLYQRMVPEPAMKIKTREIQQVVFSKRDIKRVLIGVPLVLALALIPMKNTKDIINTSDMGFISQLTEVITPAQVISEQTKLVEEPVAKPSNDKYFLIGGSFKVEENAVRFMEDMKNQGFKPVDMGIYNGLHRICIQSFSNFQEATDRLNAMCADDPQVQVWLYTKQ